jgi:hypothetical protein
MPADTMKRIEPNNQEGTAVSRTINVTARPINRDGPPISGMLPACCLRPPGLSTRPSSRAIGLIAIIEMSVAINANNAVPIYSNAHLLVDYSYKNSIKAFYY